MRRAIGIARGNPDAPFGCVIADTGSGEILSEGLIDAEKSPTLHDETAAIGVLIERRPGPETSRLAPYTTAEHCNVLQCAPTRSSGPVSPAWSTAPRLAP